MPVCCCYGGISGHCRCMSPLPCLGNGLTGRRRLRHLRRCCRARGFVLADRAMEGRASARRLRRGEADRGRAVADRTGWTRCGAIARPARRTAVFLARRGRVAGCGDVARDACARPRARRVQHDQPRNSRPRHPTAAAECDVGERLALAQHLESRDRKPVLCMDREAVRRSFGRGAVVAGPA